MLVLANLNAKADLPAKLNWRPFSGILAVRDGGGGETHGQAILNAGIRAPTLELHGTAARSALMLKRCVQAGSG